MKGMRAFDDDGAVQYLPAKRLPPPSPETDDLVIAPPPDVTRPAQSNPLIRVIPVVTAVATVGAVAAAYYARSSMARNPAFMMFPIMMIVSAVATMLSGSDRRRGEINGQRADYLGHLSEMRKAAVKAAGAQYYSALWQHPDPSTLWTLVGGRRMWERAAADSDFLRLRVGVGNLPLTARLVAPPESGNKLDPVGVAALQHFLRTHSTVANMPVSVDLRDLPVAHIRGGTAQALAVLRAMMCQLAVLHSPANVLVVAVVGDANRPDWEWLKWLPHNRHPCAYDDAGPVRMVYPSLAAAQDALSDGLAESWSLDPTAPHIVVVVDGERDDVEWPSNVAGQQVTLLVVERRNDEPVVVEASGTQVAALPDRLSRCAALVCARRLAGYRPGPMNGATTSTRWQDLVGIADIATYAPAPHWTARSPRRYLRVPVGMTADGTPVDLDIKEAAANGVGPHGLCVGATGSGKSEFLRTVALGMIVGHPPDQLNLVLVDFKGGATFAGLETAPHVAAVITNLSDKAALVARMRDALMGEMNRRQEALREAGNLDGITAYRDRRRAGAALEPLPALFIIVDEFSELLSQHPDFADVFVAIGRLGRSLGIHLLLASQRLDEGRLRGLESHLSYRVCLKTLSVNESRMMLGTSEAYELPATPGAAFLRTGTAAPLRFQTAFVSGRAARRSAVEGPVRPHYGEGSAPVRAFSTESAGPVTYVRSTENGPGEWISVLQAIVQRLAGEGPPAHEVWLPPLGVAPALSPVLRAAEPVAALTAPIGIVDRPFEQRRTALMLDLSGAAGNVAVVGAPQSGKSTTLRTLVTALAVTHEPQLVQFYCLDFGGGALASLRDLPHVGSVAGRADLDRVRNTIARLGALVRSRESLFRLHGIESMGRYRELKAARDPRCDRFGDVFLIVDGWLSLQREVGMAEALLTALAAEGLSYGVHVVLSASRWPEIRPALRDQVGTRIELRLGDPGDSEFDRRRAHQVPEGRPGRGLTHDGLQMVVALPRLDGDLAHSDGWVAPPVPVLPKRIDHRALVEQAAGRSDGVILGVEETELATLTIDFTGQLHLMILGDSECGKTAALRTVCGELLRTTTSAQCQMFVVDPRRSLLGLFDPEFGRPGDYLASADAVAEAVPRLMELLRRRMPPRDVTATQLRNRSWWSGPHIYVVIDDYDLLGAAGVTALARLAEILPHARDLGLHLVLARRVGGAARAMFEPLLAGLRDAGCMTLLMSGSPDEGLTIGSVRPSLLPPGRGVLIPRRGDPQTIHVGWTPPP